MRHVICHYHIYKNSGTTFDGILAANFGARHVCFDGPFPYFSISQPELAKIIQRHPRAVAFSSHQVALPVPSSLDFNVLPVVFVRHPLLRIHSIYRFKRAEQDGTEASRAAMEMDFEAWCRHSLSHGPLLTQVSNAQVRLLGRTCGPTLPGRRTREGMLYDLNQARRNLRNVDMLGRTECFERDVAGFPALLERHGIAFDIGDTTPRNVTSSDHAKPLDARLRELEAALAPETWAALLAANRQDLALYEEAWERLEAMSSGATTAVPSSASSISS